jgi:hypothetical protein
MLYSERNVLCSPHVSPERVRPSTIKDGPDFGRGLLVAGLFANKELLTKPNWPVACTINTRRL